MNSHYDIQQASRKSCASFFFDAGLGGSKTELEGQHVEMQRNFFFHGPIEWLLLMMPHVRDNGQLNDRAGPSFY